MDLQLFQDILHSLYQGDVDTPSSSDDVWEHRTNLLKVAINAWNAEKGILWGELWTQLSAAATGDKTVGSSDLVYACPTDFRFPGGYVRITVNGQHEYWDVLSPQKAELYLGSGVTACYFTGNPKTGYTLNFLSQPTVGATINYPYYKTPFIPSSTTDDLEMSDPYFAVYFALSKLHEIDGEGDRAVKALQEAQSRLDGMKTQNVMPAWYQDNAVPDRDTDTGSGGFGM